MAPRQIGVTYQCMCCGTFQIWAVEVVDAAVPRPEIRRKKRQHRKGDARVVLGGVGVAAAPRGRPRRDSVAALPHLRGVCAQQRVRRLGVGPRWRPFFSLFAHPVLLWRGCGVVPRRWGGRESQMGIGGGPGAENFGGGQALPLPPPCAAV